MNTRMEVDSIGTMEIPAEAYYGVHSLRAKQNFSITGYALHPVFIQNLVKIKKAAAITNRNCGQLPEKIADAIIAACDEILKGELRDQFIVEAVQGGAGTSANMNANEVIANRAIELLGGRRGDYSIVHPNDHVNMSQSTNDVIPTAAKLTVLDMLDPLSDEMSQLRSALSVKAHEFGHILTTGRTQRQDAVPMRLGQCFQAYATMTGRDVSRMRDCSREMYQVNLGGTAIGTSINASPAYLRSIVYNLSRITGRPLQMAEDLIDATQNLDCFVTVSGTLKTCAVNLSKMSNDLRLLSSGPRAGLGEIILPAKQNGSSIMPGKVNPVIPEVVSQVAFLVIGNDTSITLAAEAGQMELNAFGPVAFYKLFESIHSLTEAVRTLTFNCIAGIRANEKRCTELLESSVGVVTVLCPYIGYRKAAEIAKVSLNTGVSIRDLVLSEHLMDREELSRLLNPAAMTSPAAS